MSASTLRRILARLGGRTYPVFLALDVNGPQAQVFRDYLGDLLDEAPFFLFFVNFAGCIFIHGWCLLRHGRCLASLPRARSDAFLLKTLTSNVYTFRTLSSVLKAHALIALSRRENVGLALHPAAFQERPPWKNHFTTMM